MENDEIILGDVVCLKSGGPQMTIVKETWRHEVQYFRCVWFDTLNNSHELLDIEPAALLKVVPDR